MAWLATLAVLTALASPGDEVTVRGTVVLLPEALRERGVAADAGPIERQVVVKAEDGSLTPLIASEASKALFLDERLRGRKVEVRGRRPEGVPYLEVLAFAVEDQGRWKAPEYYCEVCAIGVRYPQPCPCCQGPLELRYQPPAR